MEDPIVQRVIERFQKRSQEGMLKYKKTLDRDDYTVNDWIEHAIEEAMDWINYLEALKHRLNQ